ncbi:MAG: hypothetical protein M0Z99_33940 [Betaproteobacteria bacterium]|nr:hypothetical protein [Betaproteobacteria bacterium]
MTTEVEAGKEKTAVNQSPDELWNKVQADRTAQAETGDPAHGAAAGGEGEQRPEGEGQADPLASLPEPARALFKTLEGRVAAQEEENKRVRQQLASANGTIGNLKQRLDASQVTLKKIEPAAEALEKANKEKAKQEAEDKEARLKDIRKRMSDMTGVSEEELAEVMGADAKPAAEEKSTAATDPAPKAEAKPGEETQSDEDKVRVLTLQRELSDRVPGWMKTRETPEFKAWRDGPGKEIFKAKSNSWDPDEVAEVFKAFDKHRSDAAEVARIEKERQDRLHRGELPQARGSTSANVDLSADAAWDKVKRDRERARTAAQ